MRWGVLVLATLLLAGCGGSKSPPPTTTASSAAEAAGCTTVPAPPAQKRTEKKPTLVLDPSTTYAVVFKTNCGNFTIQMDQKTSPHATASFVALARLGFFDHTVFHRISVGFVIQGGDPTGTGDGGPGYLTVDKPSAGTQYTHGVAAMAKTGAQPAGTAGSQFFVVTEANAGLPPDYAVIGKVVSGLGTVDRIGTLGDPNEQPTAVVEIERATVSER